MEVIKLETMSVMASSPGSVSMDSTPIDNNDSDSRYFDFDDED